MSELLFASKIKKPICMEMLSEANIPFDPKGAVADFRILMIDNDLALVDPVEEDDPSELVQVSGLKHHDCEIAGQELKVRPGEKLELEAWKAEALVKFEVAEYS